MAFYDLTPGGLGIVRGGFSAYARWVDAALKLAACRCDVRRLPLIPHGGLDGRPLLDRLRRR